MTRPWFFLSVFLVVVAASELARRRVASDLGALAPTVEFSGPQDWISAVVPSWGSEESQSAGMLESAVIMFDPRTYTPANVSQDVAARNERAFLDMIAYAEGTAGHGDDGYNVLFGYGQFDSYADHPRVYVPFGATTSSAAGRYQILARTWDGLRAKLGLSDFSPASQDAAAMELIRERGAINDVRAGRVQAATEKVRKVWASLPGAGYGQPERGMSNLLAAYGRAGGTLEQA